MGVSDCKTDNGENARMHETNTYANEMHMTTWYEMHDMNKTQNEKQNPTTEGISYHIAEKGEIVSAKQTLHMIIPVENLTYIVINHQKGGDCKCI